MTQALTDIFESGIDDEYGFADVLLPELRTVKEIPEPKPDRPQRDKNGIRILD